MGVGGGCGGVVSVMVVVMVCGGVWMCVWWSVDVCGGVWCVVWWWRWCLVAVSGSGGVCGWRSVEGGGWNV